MARRLFSSQIVDSDAFLDMPATAQALYFHLGMRADDDGFVGNPNKILKMIGCEKNDTEILLKKRFILGFESGVILIKHWLIHNTIRKDRYKKTKYLEERKSIKIKKNGAYTETNLGMTSWQPNGNQMAPQVKLSKVKLSKALTGKEKFAGNDIELLTDYFIKLTDNKERKERHYKSAGEILTLCDNSLEDSKKQLDKTMAWAEKENLNWTLETVSKKYLELKI